MVTISARREHVVHVVRKRSYSEVQRVAAASIADVSRCIPALARMTRNLSTLQRPSNGHLQGESVGLRKHRVSLSSTYLKSPVTGSERARPDMARVDASGPVHLELEALHQLLNRTIGLEHGFIPSVARPRRASQAGPQWFRNDLEPDTRRSPQPEDHPRESCLCWITCETCESLRTSGRALRLEGLSGSARRDASRPDTQSTRGFVFVPYPSQASQAPSGASASMPSPPQRAQGV